MPRHFWGAKAMKWFTNVQYLINLVKFTWLRPQIMDSTFCHWCYSLPPDSREMGGNYQLLHILFWRVTEMNLYFCAVYICKDLCRSPIASAVVLLWLPLLSVLEVRCGLWSSLLRTGKWVCGRAKRTSESWLIFFSVLISFLQSKPKASTKRRHGKLCDSHILSYFGSFATQKFF